jgi:RNA polymerase sigma factor (TIGR02999 family)
MAIFSHDVQNVPAGYTKSYSAQDCDNVQEMPSSSSSAEGDVTALLHRLQAGDSAAEGALFPLIYAEMRRLAARLMGSERHDHTLQPTALVHEAYLRIFKAGGLDYRSRAHFYAIAARTMRQILIDSARARKAAKRGGGWERLEIDLTALEGARNRVDFLALDQALERLQARAPRPSQVVEMVFFGGMAMADAALVLGVSERTVKRDWVTAKAWLYKEIYGGPDSVGQTK